MSTIDVVMSTLHLPPKTGRLAKRLKIFHAQRHRTTYPLCYVLFAAKLTDANLRLTEITKRFPIQPDFEKDYAVFEMDISSLMQFKFAFDGTNTILGDPFILLKEKAPLFNIDTKQSWLILEKLYIHEQFIEFPMMALVAIACYYITQNDKIAETLEIPPNWLKKEYDRTCLLFK